MCNIVAQDTYFQDALLLFQKDTNPGFYLDALGKVGSELNSNRMDAPFRYLGLELKSVSSLLSMVWLSSTYIENMLFL